MSRDNLLERLERVLPQTQCGQCGYTDCHQYAQALSRHETTIDRCPPGGDFGARALAWIMDTPALPYDRTRGEHKPAHIATIIEQDCIGCARCIPVCPTDCIIGAFKYMHTVMAPLCVGCELCVEICPMNCIEMQPTSTDISVDG